MDLFFVLIFIIISSASICLASYNGSQCFGTSWRSSCQFIKITCPRNTVIYMPDIRVSRRKCGRINKNYFGRSIELATEVAQCYWKRKCNIKFPKFPIFTNHWASKTRSFHVRSWKCLIQEDSRENPFLKTICDRETLSQNQSKGIILSHSQFPWNYNKDTFPRESINIDKNYFECSKVIHFNGKHRIFLSVDAFDVDRNFDKLMINNETVSETGMSRDFESSIGSIKISFTSSLTYNQDKRRKRYVTQGGSGFIICFNVGSGPHDFGASACNDLWMNPTVKAKRRLDMSNKDKQCKRLRHKNPKVRGNDQTRRKPKQRQRSRRQWRRKLFDLL